MCKMNLAIRGIDGNIGPHNADTFHNDVHKDLKADFIMANPPFNISDWGGDRLREDSRWKFGAPPVGNANFAWVQHMVHINPARSISKGMVVCWLEMSNMPTNSARALAWEHREFKSGTKFMNGDTLLARITPCLENGKTAFVDFLNDGEIGSGSTEYIVLRPKPPLPPSFAYLLARTEEFRQHVITNMTGTSGRQRAPAECLHSYSLVIPPAQIAVAFGTVVEAAIRQMKSNDEQSATLIALRKKLLPRLLGGELSL